MTRRKKIYVLDAYKKNKSAEEAIKKSKEILKSKDRDDFPWILEGEEMWASRVIDESRTEK